MNSLQECVNEYIKDGYTRNYAISKVCQDIIINRIYNSKYSDKITIKGGVVMFHLTQNIRRATIDIDKDNIEELSHQDYHGKRLTVRISDNYNKSYQIKLDIGVHKHIDILQDTLLLDTKIIDDNISFK